MKQLLLVISISSPALAYLHGYTRLHNPTTNRTIDLLHDTHVKQLFATQEQMNSLSFEQLSKRLFPTEKLVLSLLTQLDTPTTNCVFIGEASKSHSYGNTSFIDNMRSLLAPQLTHIPLICADEWRRSPRGLIDFLMHGISPRALVNKEAIIKHSGITTWHKFENLIEKTTTNIRTYTNSLNLSEADKARIIEHFLLNPLPANQLQYHKHHVTNPTYWKLADIELLSHILSAPQQRIIVYAGGIHCAALAAFLSQAGYEITHSYVTADYRDEIFTTLLNPLQDKQVPLWARIMHYTRNIIRLIFGEFVSTLINLASWITNYLFS